jgi:hypothetical protein
MTSKLKLVTYATDAFRATAQGFVASAKRSGCDDAVAFGPQDIETTPFYAAHSKILKQPRGAGYWLWKPYFIQKALQQAAPDEVILYCDAGRSPYYWMTRRPRRLEALTRANDHGFLLGPSTPHLGDLRRWTKRDCLILMGADCKEMLDRPIGVATWSLWRPTPRAFAFLDRWLGFCCDPRCLTDMPNVLGAPDHAGFRDHRHDQSILTILAHLENAPILDFSRTLVQRGIELRPNSRLAHQFYKRPENADTLLKEDNPCLLAREYLRLRAST